MCRCSRSERRPAPSETTALSCGRLGCGLQKHLAADGESEPADPAPVNVGLALQERDRGEEVLVAGPAVHVAIALALALAAAVEHEHAVAVADEHPRVLLGRRRAPGETITAAPLRDGTYQPASLRPSLVVKLTERYAVPRWAAGTGARATCVARIAIPVGTITSTDDHRGNGRLERAACVAAPAAFVEPAGAPERGGTEHDQHRSRERGETRGHVVAGDGVDRDALHPVDDPGGERERTEDQRDARAQSRPAPADTPRPRRTRSRSG